MATQQDLINYLTTTYQWSTLGVSDWFSGIKDPSGATIDPATFNMQELIDAMTTNWATLNADSAKLTAAKAKWTTLGRYRTS